MTPRKNYIALVTIIRKEVVRFFRIWTQTLLPSVITQTLYFIIFGKFIGSRVGNIGGIDYMAFIVPGLVMMAVINNSFTNVVSSFFGSKFQKNIEEMLVSSMPYWIIIAGFTIGGTLRGIICGILVFFVSIFFAHPVVYNVGIVFIFVVLTSIVFSLGGLINGIFAKKFDDVAIFPTFVLTPLTYLGGVFYSIHSLPEFWQNISRLNPILYMIDGFRYGFYGISDVSVLFSAVLLFVLAIALIFLNLYLFRKGIGLKS